MFLTLNATKMIVSDCFDYSVIGKFVEILVCI